MRDFTTRLVALLTSLRHAAAAFAARQDRVQTTWIGTQAYRPIEPPNQPPKLPAETWSLLWHRLNRLTARFQALFARWQTNTLPMPRIRASRPYTPREYLRLPTTPGWINQRIAEAAPCAGTLDILLQHPELPKFLQQAPQAGRLLRPLLHALGLTLPPYLRLPPRPKPSFSPLALGRGEPEGGSCVAEPNSAAPQGTPFRPLPANIRAAARAWKKYDK